MNTWVKRKNSTPDFVADWNSITRNTGRMIDWSVVSGAAYLAGGVKQIKAGTPMAQLASGKIVPYANRPGTETAIGLLYSTAIEGLESHAGSGYGVIIGGVVFENLLPEALSGGIKTDLQAAGTGFAFQTYADSSEV